MRCLFLFLAVYFKNVPSEPLVNTIWTFEVSKGCFDTLKFIKNNKVIEFDCEMNHTFHNSYTIIKDTVTITEKDNSQSEDKGKVHYYRSQFLIRNNLLYLISESELIKKKWQKIKSANNVKVIYKRVTK